MFFGLVLQILLIIAASSCHENKYDVEKYEAIREALEELEESQSKVQLLVQDLLLNPTRSKNNDNCVCVPFYLCNNGNIIKDGRELLENRGSFNPCHTIGDICCEPYSINMTQKSIEDADCGYSTPIATNSTPNEDDSLTKFGEFPWTTVILDENFQYQCVGSLIHPEVVLTSAHCINNSEKYMARVGEWDTTNKEETYPHQNQNVKYIIKHPDFDRSNLFYNIALLILEEPFKLGGNVKTACLSDSTPVPLRTFYDECVATGWGVTRPNEMYSRIMKKVEFSLLSHKVCEQELQSTRLGKWFDLHQTFVCAKGQYGSDLCAGNGGSPLVCPIEGQPTRYQQVGVTSWGIGCAANAPTVFAKISQVKNWIDEKFKDLKLSSAYYTFKND